MKQIWKNKTVWFFAGMTAVMVLMVLYGLQVQLDFRMYDSDLSLHRGRVREVTVNDVVVDEDGRYRGTQVLLAEVSGGEREGELIEVTNYLSRQQSYHVKQGNRIVILLDQPTEDYFVATLYSMDRELAIYLVTGFFFLLLVLVGRRTGLRAIFSLVFTFVSIIFLLIPLIMQGAPPVVTSLLVAALILAAGLTSLLGFTKKTGITVLSTGAGLVVCCILFAAVSSLLHITGYSVEEIDTLIVVAQNTEIRIASLLFVGVLIASLGALMDISVSVCSSVSELWEHDNRIGFQALLRSGLRVGSDVTGSMTNTLILAFTGSFFISLLLYRIYRLEYLQLINMSSIAIEIAQALSASMALILTAPITAFVSARVYSRQNGVESAAGDGAGGKRAGFDKPGRAAPPKKKTA